jgi:DNA invertase Pin-like site-specific DNA recombinase
MATTEITTAARAAIYARVSTSEQSPELQIRDLRQYASARGLTATEYVDTGYSGAKQSRPGSARHKSCARTKILTTAATITV